MTITNLVKGWTSPFKPKELAYLLPLDVFDKSMIIKVLKWYFPALKLSEEQLMKWSDVRARPFFECLILPLLQLVKSSLHSEHGSIITTNELQEAFDKNELDYFQLAVNMFQGYIKGSIERFINDALDSDTFVNQCWSLYCATLFRDETFSLEPVHVAELLSSGFISIKELKPNVRTAGPERIPFLALTKYFSSEAIGKQVAHNNFKKRIIQAASDSAAVGYVFEKLCIYLLVSRFCNTKQLLSKAPPFSKCSDKYIDYYVFECTYLLRVNNVQESNMNIMEQFLKERSTTYVLKIPDGSYGPDELFWLRRMTIAECNNAGLSTINLDELPTHRLVLAQLSVGTKPGKVLQNVWLSEIVETDDKNGMASEMPRQDDYSEDGIHCFASNSNAIDKKMRELFQMVHKENSEIFSGYIALLLIRDPYESANIMIPGTDYTPNKHKTFCSITVREMLDNDNLYQSMHLSDSTTTQKRKHTVYSDEEYDS
jgi:hypothetical protein